MADGQYTSFPIDFEIINLAGMQQDISDLETAIAGKQDTLTAGTGISIVNDVISATGGGGGGGGGDPYDNNPEALGTASPGVSDRYSRGDHVHPKPTASDIGAIAAPSSPETGAFLVWNGTAWVAQTLSVWQGGSF